MKYLLIPLAMTLLAAGCNQAPGPASRTQDQTPTAQTQATATAGAANPTNVAAPAPAPAAQPAPSTAPKTTTKKPINTTVPNSTKTVLIYAGSFSPQVLAVKAGDTVVWVNKDSTGHTSASDGALLWDSGNIAPGASYRRVFKATGTYPYRDSIKNFKGTVVVY